jgi:very-short-patch-repair endonuclease
LIDAKLNEIRCRLLDLTRNNRLLNHRSRGQRTLQIVDEIPVEIYRILVDEGQIMQFLSREEAPEEIRDALPTDETESNAPSTPDAVLSEGVGLNAVLSLAPMAGDSSVASRHCDRNLQTFLSSQKLQTRLVHLSREATSSIEEQGCNILYLTLGMVEWCEADASSETSRAPLVFIPVELKRKTVNTRFSVQLFDDDIVANSSLAELCQNQFHFDFPGFDAENDKLNSYFIKVQQAIAGMHGWRFFPELHLGLFSFSKLLMYRDLDPQNWPEGERLTSHALIRQLTGLDSDGSADGDGIPDPSTLDQILKPADCFQIVDADSSQQAGILAAKRGVSMVIDGPPGTGKSQTITNIIAECLAAGRTVLFVSEKAAALEVVKRRLEKNGAGDFVLELHSRQASKKSVLTEINRVLERSAAAGRASEQTAEDLKRVRETLNAHHRELHERLGALDVSPFEAMSRAIGLSAEPEADCDIPSVMEWPAPELGDANEQLQLLDRRLNRVGEPAKHPWRGVGLQSVGLKEKQRINKALQELVDSIRKLAQAASKLASHLGRPAPASVRDCSEPTAIAKILIETPSELATVFEDDRWNSANSELSDWINLGQQRQKLQQAWKGIFRADAELQDWKAALKRREARRRSILRLLFPSWHSDGKAISSYTLDGKLPSVDKQLELLATLEESAKLRKQIEERSPQFSVQFGTTWQGIDGNWEKLAHYATTAVTLRQMTRSNQIDAATVNRIIAMPMRDELASLTNSVESGLDRLQRSWQEWLAAIGSDETQWLKADWTSSDLANVVTRLETLQKQSETLDDWVDLRQSVRECSNGPLTTYIAWVFGPKGQIAHGRLAATFNRHFYRLWIEEALASRPSLRGFRGQDHEAIITQFKALDRQWIEMTRHRLAEKIASRRPEANRTAHRQSKLGLLMAEVRKKTRHMPLRKLLKEAGEVIQAIKPCFMMSPLSVAQYLAPGGLEFDVVVFDEASQVEPADAYGAVARGGQLILVGDERQLPPTNFFDRIDREETDSGDDAEVRSTDLESILSLGIVRLRHRCGLRWHYRSRHSSLIEFSNQKFYDGQLRVFPSPHTDCSEMGLAFRYVEGAIYMRGAGRYNPKEAQAVAAAVIEHAIENPDVSLGVGTLNQPQQRAIEDEIERLRRTNGDPRLEQYFANHISRGEPFFVKNLENIQGDERDVIFLSITFGKDANGRQSANFRALNRDGGWRRLNVLITRARKRCVVFSSIRHDDIDLGSTQVRGVVTLKEFLYAAEHGRLKDAAVPGGDHDSDFEASVCRALRDHGWQVHAQVGCAGFAIDLAVVDPRSPGRYLLGIECDGATYHSSPTARDRDRLRQEVLEDLGWSIYRIWSTDWFHRPTGVLDGLLKRLEELKNADSGIAPRSNANAHVRTPPPDNPPSSASPQTSSTAHQQEPERETSRDGLPPGVSLYQCHRKHMIVNGLSLVDTPPPKLAAILRKLVEIEGPIHVDELGRACAEIFGTKATVRPREAVDRGIALAIANGWIIEKDSFLRSTQQQNSPIRFRSNDCPVTNPDLISPEEFEAAIMLVLRQQFGLRFEALIEAVTRTFGFARTGPKLKSAIEGAIVHLDQRGEIQQDSSGFVTLSETARDAAPT